ncbi:MAG: hypothetical protein ACAH89_13045 [Rariglobus sp.]
MSDTPDTPVPPTPAPVPAPVPVAPAAPIGLKPPSAPGLGLRPPVSAAPAAPAAPSAPLTAPSAPLRAPVAASAPAPAFQAAAKLPERPAFVSPMPTIENSDDSLPAFMPIVAGFAAAVAIAFAVLIYLKQ